MESSWIDELRQAAQTEGAPLIATLATVRTVDTHAVPEARSVVVRRIGDDGTLLFTSDSRSEKGVQLNDEPRVAVIFWLPKTRTQFRINGSVRLSMTASPERGDVWKTLSDTARAVFAWPPPGRPVVAGDSYPKSLTADGGPPESFDVWHVVPDFADTLDLRPHPHLRRKWTKTGSAWTAVIVNP